MLVFPSSQLPNYVLRSRSVKNPLIFALARFRGADRIRTCTAVFTHGFGNPQIDILGNHLFASTIPPLRHVRVFPRLSPFAICASNRICFLKAIPPIYYGCVVGPHHSLSGWELNPHFYNITHVSVLPDYLRLITSLCCSDDSRITKLYSFPLSREQHNNIPCQPQVC